MIVKINGVVVKEERAFVVPEVGAPSAAKQKWAVRCGVAAAVATGLLVGDVTIAHAAGAATAEASKSFRFDDVMISSVKYTVMLLAVLGMFKKDWMKTGAAFSGAIYGAWFCGGAISTGFALFFTWLNINLQQWLESLRMGA